MTLTDVTKINLPDQRSLKPSVLRRMFKNGLCSVVLLRIETAYFEAVQHTSIAVFPDTEIRGCWFYLEW